MKKNLVNFSEKGLAGKVLEVQFKTLKQHFKEREEEKRKRFLIVFAEYRKYPESHPEITRAIIQYKEKSKQKSVTYGGIYSRECPICNTSEVRAYDFCPDCLKLYLQEKNYTHRIYRFIRGLF